MMKGLISIGEMSEICKVSKRTLRYYDVIELIKPAFTNPKNGYRFYEPYQVGRIHLVKQMQELGISLEDVAAFVREKGAEISIEECYLCMKKRETEVGQELKLLKKQQNDLRSYTAQYEEIREQLGKIDTQVRIEYFPRRVLICKSFVGKLEKGMFGRTFAEIGSSIQNQSKRNYEIIPQIGSCFYGQRNSENCMNYVGFFTLENALDLPFELKEIEEGYYACYRYIGEYNRIDEQYAILRSYLAKMNYYMKDFCVERYTISPSVNLKESEYITELQVPIIFCK